MVEKVANVPLQDIFNFLLDIAYTCLELITFVSLKLKMDTFNIKCWH
jgi:hypothetical protein